MSALTIRINMKVSIRVKIYEQVAEAYFYLLIQTVVATLPTEKEGNDLAAADN